MQGREPLRGRDLTSQKPRLLKKKTPKKLHCTFPPVRLTRFILKG